MEFPCGILPYICDDWPEVVNLFTIILNSLLFILNAAACYQTICVQHLSVFAVSGFLNTLVVTVLIDFAIILCQYTNRTMAVM